MVWSLAGCAAQIEDAPASFETLQRLREQGVPPVALGQFTLASKDVGRGVAVRLSVMHAPKGKDFAGVLRDAFATQLRAAGKLDDASTLRVDGVLTESRLSDDMAKGGAALGVSITVSRGGAVILTKPYRVESGLKSDFIGAIAITEAFQQYNALYATLARNVLADPDFVAAAKGAR